MPVFAIPAFWSAVAAGAGAGAGIYAANKTSGAATEAANIQANAATQGAELQAKSAADALALSKQNSAMTLAEYNAQGARLQPYRNLGNWALGQPNQPYTPVTLPPPDTSSSNTNPSTPPSTSSTSSASSMPPGIDPRFAAVYQQAGVTPGARGSGPTDWQYYQYDAVKNANGDVNYVLGRLKQDLQSGNTSTQSPPSQRTLIQPNTQYTPISGFALPPVSVNG